MGVALGLARRGLGNVWPNPAVGCVIVREGEIVGRGWTQPGGRPHAETEALKRAGEKAKGATAFVTLEPCDHTGKTSPCSQALIDAGITKIVVATTDPDPRVSGKGIDRLKKAGIEVVVDVCKAEADALNEGFFRRIKDNRPLFTLKTATTLDGRIATHSGESQWITGASARKVGHWLRANHDAIMVGSGTAITDNPELTCRLPGMEEHSPVRIFFDSRMRLPLTHKLVSTALKTPTWMVTLPGGDQTRKEAFHNCGVVIIEVEADKDGYPNLPLAAKAFAERGLTRVLVEGGSHLAATLLEYDLIDRVAWMRAPKIIGGDGIPALTGFGVDKLLQAAEFKRTSLGEAGIDQVEFYKRKDKE
ncbi:MAG: bifunctional diaminohydroxyphosphoribosylaminopyrimidine deaminase/5-amino-6-(5-phosphoribosylamino)uracil reductase RibD [Rhodospirillales bacterium]|nr:bifunctional diaminohydroxyphosphoribosylaminopyrimidine deaminase/5-amino-6-(5-phosphoribosylamino)uracil reductase RibD [Rhodospirillales bacterium]